MLRPCLLLRMVRLPLLVPCPRPLHRQDQESSVQSRSRNFRRLRPPTAQCETFRFGAGSDLLHGYGTGGKRNGPHMKSQVTSKVTHRST